MMVWEPANSRAFSQIGYDPDREEVGVRFNGSPKDYVTENVSPEMYNEFKNAASQYEFWRVNWSTTK